MNACTLLRSAFRSSMVGALNLISVAFAVLFVGIGVDFGIQFSVRYRHERHSLEALREALVAAGRNAGKPLALAAAATMAGFYAFLPTAYRGVSELGLIAGTGMVIAFLTSITLSPALLVLLNPPGEPDDVGYRMLAPVDRFMARHRIAILAITAIAVAAGLPLLQRLTFDFNPINLRSDKVESVATFNDLMKDPATGQPHTAHTLFPVPILYVNDADRDAKLLGGGRICDVAPTMLALMGLPQPSAMTGHSLLAR